jgi:hypothetical protein
VSESARSGAAADSIALLGGGEQSFKTSHQFLADNNDHDYHHHTIRGGQRIGRAVSLGVGERAVANGLKRISEREILSTSRQRVCERSGSVALVVRAGWGPAAIKCVRALSGEEG